jgi:pimeloyl-ACP methyl ester carboxylesterase
MSAIRSYPRRVHPVLSRRQVIAGTGATAAVGIAAVGYSLVRDKPMFRRLFTDPGPLATVPDAPEGDIRHETRQSSARGQPVGLFTAVPAGHGDGAGLPVCLVLHGGSATTADFREFGFGRFLSAAVQAGTRPFVLAGVDGGGNGWGPGQDGDDPQRLLLDELPTWLDERGFDTSMLAAWGWSMGGHGVLLLGEAAPERFRAIAAFSPAIPDGASAPDDVWNAKERLDPDRTGLWCGTSDSFYPRVKRFAGALASRPALARWEAGGHTRPYWNRITPEAFAFIGDRLIRK